MVGRVAVFSVMTTLVSLSSNLRSRWSMRDDRCSCGVMLCNVRTTEIRLSRILTSNTLNIAACRAWRTGRLAPSKYSGQCT